MDLKKIVLTGLVSLMAMCFSNVDAAEIHGKCYRGEERFYNTPNNTGLERVNNFEEWYTVTVEQGDTLNKILQKINKLREKKDICEDVEESRYSDGLYCDYGERENFYPATLKDILTNEGEIIDPKKIIKSGSKLNVVLPIQYISQCYHKPAIIPLMWL